MSLKGKLLVASPALTDPHFVRTVILIAEHSGDGALGVVLNRASDSLVADSVDELRGVVIPGDPVHFGGPVQAEGVMVLAEFSEPSLAAALVIGMVGFLPAEADMDEIAAGTVRARVFAGHSGWGPGQLEAEIDEGAWIVVAGTVDDVFGETPLALWSAVLERKGGAYALLARAPEDPSLN